MVELSILKHPTSFLKLVEVIVGIICIALAFNACVSNDNVGRLITVTICSNLIISPSIFIINLVFYEKDRKPYLAAVLNFVAFILYLIVSGITLTYIGSNYVKTSCIHVSITLGVFALINTAAYIGDTVFTIMIVVGK